MSNYQCHYECLKVTRDAPAEVIRAAYRSLSQKHHPDKNSGDGEAARVMARLNHAYSVLSDPAQRELYDAQLLHEQRAREYYGAFQESDDDGEAASSGGAGRTLLHRVSLYVTGRKGRIAAVVLCAVCIAAGGTLRSIWKERQSMLLLEQAAMPAAGPADYATVQVQPHAGTAPQPAGTDAEPTKQAAAPAEPVVVTKTSEFERLTELLKSMGLGLHKLDAPANARRPSLPAQSAEPDKLALAANTAAPPARLPAPAPLVPPEAGRPREETERPATPDPVRADAGRASAPQAPAANATAAALRQAVIADARACAPSYPARAYSNGESGTVQLALLVGGDGGVIESKVQKSSGHPELDKAARKALSQCHFKVAGNDRPAEPVWANVEYAFSLD
jgi:TonB family protein